MPVAVLANQLGTLEQRVVQLEQRPAPAPLAPLTDQIGGLEQRVVQLEQRPAPAPLAPLANKIGGLEQRVVQLEQRPVPAPVAPLADKIGGLEQRVVQLEQRPAPVSVAPASVAAPEAPPPAADPGTVASLASRLQTLEQRLGLAEQAIRTGTARTARLHAANMALDAGKPLGDLAGAPPALARFAVVGPPTEAALRLSFPAAANAAIQASAPPTTGLSLPWRMWQQVQTLVSIRQGDTVLVGTPATHVLAQAQARLDVGDLAGAVAALDDLDASAASAIAGWREQAQSLLDARAALAGLEHS